MAASSPGQTFVLAIFLDDLLAAGGLSRSVLSVVYGAATVASATVSFLAGRTSERVGLRAAWVVVSVGLALACGLAAAASGTVLVLAALVLLRSLGQGCFPLLSTLVVVRGSDRPGRNMATASLGALLASAALPPLVALSIGAIGWRQTFLVCGSTIALLAPLAILLPRPGAGAPRRLGPDAPSRPRIRTRRGPPLGERLTAYAVLAAPPLVTTGLVLNAVALFGDRGASPARAAGAIAAMGLAAVIGIGAAGALSDRLSVRTHLVTTAATLLIATAILLLPSAGAAYVAFAALGLGGAVWQVTGGIVWTRTYGDEHLGRLQGTAHAVKIGGAALGPLPIALSLELSGGLRLGIGVMIAVAAGSLAAALAWRPRMTGRLVGDAVQAAARP